MQSPGKITGDYEIARILMPEELTNSIGMKLKLIPAGQFMMGSSESPEKLAEVLKEYGAKVEYFEDEHPQHRVRITRPFYLGVYEVTVGQFGKFVEETEYKTDAEKAGEGGFGWNASEKKFEGRDPKYSWRETGFAQDDRHPVVNVSWNDATAFCEWLSRKERKTYRLPTEAQWEYACRAGTRTRYYSGNDPSDLKGVANIGDASLKQACSSERWTVSWKDGFAFAAPVGRFQPNAFGLHDMHGNVWEWCSDWYAKDYYENSPASDPTGPTTGSYRVDRGGSWQGIPRGCPSATRYRSAPGYGYYGLGFRVALVPAE